MNKTVTLVVLALLSVVFATTASADLVVSDVQFGDNTQERNQNITKTFTITNNNTATAVSDLSVAFSGTDISQYKLAVTSATGLTGTVSISTSTSGVVTFGSGVTLAPSGVASITAQAFVPQKFSAVDSTVTETALEIGTTQVSGTEGATPKTGQGKLSMQAKNKLVIDDMTVTVNGESETVSDGERVDQIKPGDKIEIEIIAKNQFSDSSSVDIDVDDVLVQIKSSDQDELDVDEEEDLGTLSAKSEDSATFSFDVEDTTDDSTYTVTVTASGVDQNGAKHGEKQTIRLKIERETHEISVKRAEVVPATIECEGSHLVTVDATVNNIGQRDEDEVVVEAVVSQLGFSKKIDGIKLNDGKSKTVQFAIDVPDDAEPGTYRVDINTYYETTVKSNTKALSFSVDTCEEEPVVVPPAPVVVTPTPTPVPTQEPALQPPKARVTSTESFTDSTLYIYLLAGLSGLLLLFLIVVVAVLATRRSRDDDD